MFTGIIEAVGEIRRIEKRGADARMQIGTGKLDLTDVAIGDSIATNGVCLTAVELAGDSYWADVSGETLSRTSIGDLAVGSEVNLEKALTPSTRLGGHLVSGHVDGVGEVVDRYDDGRSVRFRIQAPDELAHYIATKGSICVDGVSLTVNDVDGAVFDLNIVPHTMAETTIRDYRKGTRVNLEVDIIARYLERLLLGGQAANVSGDITLDKLAEHGFLDPHGK